MKVPSDILPITSGELIAMLNSHPQWARLKVIADLDDELEAVAYIDKVLWQDGGLEIKCVFDEAIKLHDQSEIDELENKIDERDNTIKDKQETIDTLVELLKRFDANMQGGGTPEELDKDLAELHKDVQSELVMLVKF